MAKFFVIKAVLQLGKYTSRFIIRGKQTYYFKNVGWKRCYIILIPFSLDPFSEPYVSYRLKDDRYAAYGNNSVHQWVIRVPDYHIVEFKLKYNEIIFKEYG